MVQSDLWVVGLGGLRRQQLARFYTGKQGNGARTGEDPT